MTRVLRMVGLLGRKGKSMLSAIVSICGALALACGSVGHAAIIWDQSPGAIGGTEFNSLSNRSAAQNFSDPVLFGTDHIVFGMDIYAGTAFVNAGDALVVRIRANAIDAVPIEFIETINIKDLDGIGSAPASAARVHVDFSVPVLLLGSTTYFLGMSGVGFDEVGQLVVNGGTGPLLNGSAHTYNGLVYVSDSAPGDTAFRLHGPQLPNPVLFGCSPLRFGRWG